MNEALKTILRAVGLLIQVPGIMALLSIPICLIFGEYRAIIPFLLTAFISLAGGQFLYRCFRQYRVTNRRRALQTVALGWAAIFFLGAIPYFTISIQQTGVAAIAPFQLPLNALFESVSGFTSTGLSMTASSNELPHAIQWWRSFTQWIGGLGIIVLTLTVLDPSDQSDRLYQGEGRQERLAPTIRQTAQKIWVIYVLYTLASIGLFIIAGMPGWEAINQGMTAIATGGFAISGSSFEAYDPAIKLVAILVMITGAISFFIHARVLQRGDISALWQDTRHGTLWLLLGVGAVALCLEHYWYTGIWNAIDSAFQWTSALTTCGFASIAEQDWSQSSRLLFSVAMVVGGIAGSTVGGLKIDRLVILHRSLLWYLRLLLEESPEELRFRLNGRWLDDEDAHRHLKAATVLATLWIMAVLIGVIVLLHGVREQFSLIDVLLETTSALGTSGLSIGITSPELAGSGKVTLMILMWVGRLEIISAIALFSPFLKLFSAEREDPDQRNKKRGKT